MKRIFLLLILTLIVFLSVGFASPTFAITVSPAKIEVTALPGQTAYGEIQLFNEQTEPKTFFSSYENFESRGEGGAPYFIGGREGLATWISIAPQVTVDPGQRLQVPYTIAVPADANPGGHFAAIFFGSQPPVIEGGGEVAIGGKIGVLVLLTVSGEIMESAGLVDFGAKGEQRFFTMLPVTLEYRFNNIGGDRVVPKGEITIRNTLRLISATLPANQREGNVLPNSTRRFEVIWSEMRDKAEGPLGFFATAWQQLRDIRIGWYTATIALSWGADNQITNELSRSSYHFFIIPWQLLSILLFFGLIFWLIGRTILRRYKRRIIAEALQQK